MPADGNDAVDCIPVLLDRHRRPGFLHVLALVGHKRANAAPLVAGHEDLARLQRALLDKHRRHRTASGKHLVFHYGNVTYFAAPLQTGPGVIQTTHVRSIW